MIRLPMMGESAKIKKPIKKLRDIKHELVNSREKKDSE